MIDSIDIQRATLNLFDFVYQGQENRVAAIPVVWTTPGSPELGGL
jgi:hypothetical protein